MNQHGFVLPSFLMPPTGIMAALIVALSLSNLLFYKLWRGEVDEYAQFKADVVAQQRQLQADAEKARVESERITKQTADGWAAAVAWHQRNPRTVRVSASCDPSGLRPVPSSISGFAQAPTQSGLGAAADEAVAITADQCEDRLNNAVFDASQLMWLQAWVIKQHEVKP